MGKISSKNSKNNFSKNNNQQNGKNSKSDPKKKSPPPRKRRKACCGCGCLMPIISIVVVFAIMFFVGDYFSKQYLGMSAGKVLGTVSRVLGGRESKIVTNPYSDRDYGEFETALKNQLLLKDSYDIPLDELQELVNSGAETSAILALLLDANNFDTSKLADFDYETSPTAMVLRDTNFAALIDSLISSVAASQLQKTDLPFSTQALEFGVPQILFYEENNPHYAPTPAASTAFEEEEENNESEPTEEEDEPFVEPEKVQYIKMTVKLHLRKLVAGMLDEYVPGLSAWVSWMVKENFFVTVSVPVNSLAADLKIYINAMTDEDMETLFTLVGRISAIIGKEFDLADMLHTSFAPIQEMMVGALTDGGIGFSKDSTGKLVIELDIIDFVLRLADIAEMSSRDILLMLKTLLVEMNVDIDALEQQLAAENLALTTQLQEKYLLKDGHDAVGLVTSLMDGSTNSDDDTNPDDTNPQKTAARLKASLFGEEEPTEEEPTEEEPTTDDSNDIMSFIETRKIKQLYDKNKSAADFDVEINGMQLAALFDGVLSSGKIDFDIGGMSLKMVELELLTVYVDGENPGDPQVAQTVMRLCMGMSPRSLLENQDIGEDNKMVIDFLINLLPAMIYCDIEINLDAEGSSAEFALNGASKTDTDKILKIIGQFTGQDMGLDSIATEAADTVRNLIDEIRKMIGLDFIVKNDGGEEKTYARLANLFEVIVKQLNLTDAQNPDEPLDADKLKNMLSGLQIEDPENMDNENNVAEQLVVRDNADETVAAYNASLAVANTTFGNTLNDKYYLKEDSRLDTDAILEGKIDSSTINVSSINGKKLRNDPAPYSDLGVSLNERALTYIIQQKLAGGTDGETNPDSISIGAGLTVVQVRVITANNKTIFSLLIDVDMATMAGDAFSSYPGLIPDKMYITSRTSFAGKASLIDENDPNSTTIRINLFDFITNDNDADSAENGSPTPETNDLINIIENISPGALNKDDISKQISEGLKKALGEIENMFTEDEKCYLTYDRGIILPSIFDMISLLVLQKPENGSKLTGEELREVIKGMEQRTSDDDYYVALGDFLDEQTFEYDTVAFEAEEQRYDEGLDNAKADLNSDISSKYFILPEVQDDGEGGTITKEFDADELFGSDLFATFSPSRFDGAGIRTNTRTLGEMYPLISEMSLVSIINKQINVSDAATPANPQVFGEEEGQDSGDPADPADSGANQFEVVQIRIKTETEAGTANVSNVIFSIVIKVSLGAQLGNSVGDVMPEFIYVIADINFNAATAAAAKSNNQAFADAGSPDDYQGNPTPTTEISINRLGETPDGMDKFNSLIAQLGTEFNIDSIAGTLQDTLISALADMEQYVHVAYEKGALKLASVYTLIRDMTKQSGGISTDPTELTELHIKELFENFEQSEKVYLNENETDKEVDLGVEIPYPMSRDYDDAGEYSREFNEYLNGFESAMNAFFAETEEKYFINEGAITAESLFAGGLFGNQANFNLTKAQRTFYVSKGVNPDDPLNPLAIRPTEQEQNDAINTLQGRPGLTQSAFAGLAQERKSTINSGYGGEGGNDLGAISSENINFVEAKIYREGGTVFMRTTLFATGMSAGNSNMGQLLPDDLYITTTVYNDGSGWRTLTEDGTDGGEPMIAVNWMSAKVHSDGTTIMMDTFDKLMTKTFGSGAGFGALGGLISDAVCAALGAIEPILVGGMTDDGSGVEYPAFYLSGTSGSESGFYLKSADDMISGFVSLPF